MKKFLLLVLSIVIIIFAFYYYSYYSSETKNDLQTENSQQAVSLKPKVIINDNEIFVDLAKTAEELSKGLSGREKLNDDEGMLFLFGSKSYQTFWMKDMLIPIDIIWISDDMIVDISKNVPQPVPGTAQYQLQIYSPTKPVNYVLEVNAGFSDKYGIKIGDTVDISNIK